MRNSVFSETAVLDDALTVLNGLLPSPWTCALRRGEVGTQPRLDARAELIRPGAPPIILAVEAQRSGSATLSTIMGRLRDLQTGTRLPVLFVSDYIGPALRRALAEADLNYLDATGWVRISLAKPLVFISNQGAAKAPRRRASTATSRLDGLATSRIIRTLVDVDPPVGVRELASDAAVSPGTVSKLLSTLTAESIIERDDSGRVATINRPALLERWTQDYSFEGTNPSVTYFIAPRGLSRAVDALASCPDATLTGSLAARRLLPDDVTPVVPLRLLALYSPDPASTGAALDLLPSDRATANVIIARPQDPTIVAESTDERTRLAPLGLVLADLLTLPGRGSAEADQLMSARATSEPAWR